jgi:Raf kinase inhibitor-like YbhB/YbcL family protein
MEVVFEGLIEGEKVPERYTCDGPGISPEIDWRNPPNATKSFAVVMDDPDAPRGTFVHWIAWDIPAKSNRLPANLARQRDLPNGIKQGVNSGGAYGYYPCCPPPGKPHHYTFRFMALDAELDLPAGVNRERFDKAVKGHILEQVSVTGIYERF